MRIDYNMKDIRNLTYYGNKSFTNIKGLLMKNGVKKFHNIHKSLEIFNEITITFTRFEFIWNKDLYFCLCEPKTDIFKIDIKPIKISY